MLFMSTTISALVGTARRPSTSTRLRLAPRPRSEIEAIPTELIDEICTSEFVPSMVGVAAGLYAGSWFRYDSMFRPDWLSSWAASTVTSGLLASVSRRTMREPVTTTSARPSSAASATAGDGRVAGKCDAGQDGGDSRAHGEALIR